MEFFSYYGDAIILFMFAFSKEFVKFMERDST
jgi:hypothetical protein